ncbi:MAG: STAS domain-containing protein [Acidimicrobiales bacterium]|nr:STAS domain-containing protein [Acidimicrobiales bacterium]
MTANLLTVDVTRKEGVDVLTLSGELDLSSVPALEEALAGVAPGAEQVVVDLGRLRFMDSAGIGCLARAQLELRKANRRLVLHSPSGAVRKVLEMTGLDQKIEISAP